jgi:hypothetical protein
MTLTDAALAFFRDATLTREEIDRFLDPDAPSWARFDEQLGYLPNDSDVPDNIDGAISEYRYGPLGERRRINHSTDPCRLNTYGDSFTQCHQVSDGETWQEVLAAHLHEPVRNFGVGGFGVHQAVTRLRRVEAGPGKAPFVILNIYLDDHYRSIDAYRLLRLGRWWRDYDRSLTTSMFHANPWEHVRLDPATGELVVRPNLCPTAESLYDLCDTDFLIHHFEHDLVTQKLIADQSGRYDYLEEYEDLLGRLGIAHPAAASPRATAHALWESCAFEATRLILTGLRDEMQAAGKQLMILLTYPAETVVGHLADGSRPDGPVIDAIEGLGLPYVDGLALHAADYADFKPDPEAYTRRYYAGHYTPLGNAHYAFMIKQRLVEWLTPPPPAYRVDDSASFARQAARLA